MAKRLVFLVVIVLLPILCALADDKTSSPSTNTNELPTFSVPPDLAPWVEWVKARHPEWLCARNASQVECVWPGALRYQLTSSGAQFTLQVELLKEGEVPLPANASMFPHQISVKTDAGENVSAPLLLNNGQLSVKLPRGIFEVRGSFSWSSLPPELPIPAAYGTVEVALPENTKGLHVRRGPQSLWLEKEEENPTTDSLSISVMRKIEDGSPLAIHTLLRLRISGRSRPLQIPALLPAGATPVLIESALPAQLTSEGSLALQLLPGEYEIQVLALMQQPVSQIAAPRVEIADWPKEEVWSWQPDMGFRSVELSGAQPLHADLTQLPQAWKGGAVYVVNSGSTANLKEVRRGEESQAPDELRLMREIWVDLDGPGATVRDRFSGRINKNFRLNALPETKVGRATVDQQSALVTLDPKDKTPGVELRNQNVNVEVVSRLENSRSLHATGWGTTAEQLSFALHVPPAWRLLHVSGAEEARGSWVDTWSLLHIFISILLVLSAYKLFGPALAGVLGISMLLNHGEFLAPRMLYVHIMLLAAWKLLTDGKESTWRTLSRALLAITYAAWSLQSLAFAKLQFTEVLFPQLQAGTRYRTILQELISTIEDSLLMWPLLLLIMAVAFLGLRAVVNSKSIGRAIFKLFLFGAGFVVLLIVLSGIYSTVATRSQYSERQYSQNMPVPMAATMDATESFQPEVRAHSAKKNSKAKQEDATNTAFSYQGKNLLSGPAVPSWSWHTFSISVATPVDASHEIRLYLLSPGVSRVLAACRAILSLLLVGLFFKAFGYTLGKFESGAMSSSASSAAICLMLVLFAPVSAHADTPSTDLLQELEKRYAQQLCEDAQCSVIQSAHFTLSQKKIKLTLDVQSHGISSVDIPGPLDVLSPKVVKVNARDSVALRRNANGYLSVRTANGRNTIEIEASLGEEQAISLQFPQKPLQVSVDAPDWYVEGISQFGSVEQGIRLVSKAPRDKSVAPTKKNDATEGLKTWVKVTRTVTVGEQISIHAEVERLGSFENEAHVRIPLVPGEQVTSGAVSIENNELLLGLAANMQKQSFGSAIPFNSTIAFTSKPTPGVSEEWVVFCQPIVSCEFEGLTPLSSTLNGMRQFRWLPFPGEGVQLKIQALNGLQGDFVTVDDLTHVISWGANLLEGALSANVRVTQQTSFKMTAPPGASIRKVTVDSQAGRSSDKGVESSVLLTPGNHKIDFSYSLPWAPELRENVPEVQVSAPVNNVTITVHPSSDRWILWTGGLSWGPCVVFWAKLLLIILICVQMSRLGVLPSTQLGAGLIGAGLATLPIVAMVVPLAWLVSLVLIPRFDAKLLFIPRWIRMFGFIGLSLLSLLLWYNVVQTGLVFSPPMLIVGKGSSAYALNWYTDHAQGVLPSPWVISLPIWIWRVVALLWSTWLVTALFSWLRLCVSIVRSKFFALKVQAE